MHTHLWLARGGAEPDRTVAAALRIAPAAAIACAAAAVHLASGSPGDDYLVVAAILCVAALCALRFRALVHSRAGWLALALATAALAAGRLLGAADVGHVCGYVLGGVGLALVSRARFRRASWPLLLDGVVTALTLAALVRAIGSSLGAGASHHDVPLLNVVVLAVVTAIAVWQGFRPSLESALISSSLVALALTNGNDFGLLLGASLIAVATCVAHDTKHERHAPERWLAIVAPTALSFANVVLLSYGRFFHHLSGSSMLLARLAFLAAFVRVFLSFVATQRMLTSSLKEAASDALTGLPNRRALIADADGLFRPASPQHVLAIYDLDGFKQYNDTFGHDDGDTMLSMLGRRLTATVADRGRIYRLGGDEFCLIAPVEGGDHEALIADLGVALSEEGPGFAIRPSYGSALIPAEASDLTKALRLADRRMYAHKATRSPEPALELVPPRVANA